MKLINKYHFIWIMAVVLFASCEKNKLTLIDTTDPSSGGYFKLGWFSPSIRHQGVVLKINGQRVSNQLGLGFTSTTNYAMPFPGGGLNTGGNNKNDYLAVPTGSIEVGIVIPKKNTPTEDSIEILKTNMNIEQGKYYTLIATDSLPTFTHYTLNDDIALADSGSIKLRFTNAIPNLGGNIDFLRSNTTTGLNQVVAGNLAYKAATDFLVLPSVVGSDTIKIRRTGTTTILATYATSSMTTRRAFTVVSRGYNAGTGSRAPAISLIYNR